MRSESTLITFRFLGVRSKIVVDVVQYLCYLMLLQLADIYPVLYPEYVRLARLFAKLHAPDRESEYDGCINSVISTVIYLCLHFCCCFRFHGVT